MRWDYFSERQLIKQFVLKWVERKGSSVGQRYLHGWLDGIHECYVRCFIFSRLHLWRAKESYGHTIVIAKPAAGNGDIPEGWVANYPFWRCGEGYNLLLPLVSLLSSLTTVFVKPKKTKYTWLVLFVYFFNGFVWIK